MTSPVTNNMTFDLSEKNVSNITEAAVESLWKFDSVLLTVVIVVCLSVVPVLTIVGNCFVVWAISTQKCLKQVQNRLLISLAVADILVALIVMPFAIFYEVAGYTPLSSFPFSVTF